jgi:hypothetical protein
MGAIRSLPEVDYSPVLLMTVAVPDPGIEEQHVTERLKQLRFTRVLL